MKAVFVVLKKGWEWSEIVGVYENDLQADHKAKELEEGKHQSGGTLDKHSTFTVEKHEIL